MYRDGQDQDAILVGLRGSQGLQGSCHDHAVLGLLRHGAGNEQPIGYAFPDLLPDGCGTCLCPRRGIWSYEPLSGPWVGSRATSSSTSDSTAAPGHSSSPSSLQQFSSLALAWRTTRSHGAWPWQCWCASPSLSRWLREPAAALCPS